jgi:hypothetical protein
MSLPEAGLAMIPMTPMACVGRVVRQPCYRASCFLASATIRAALGT